MLEIGKTYYFISHAYYGTWSQFYDNGEVAKMQYDSIADSPDFSYINAFDWNHPVPPRK